MNQIEKEHLDPRMIEDAQAYLERNWNAHVSSQSLKREIAMIRDRIGEIKELRASKMSGQVAAEHLAELKARYRNVEREVLKKLDQSYTVYRECQKSIEAVEKPNYRALLELRYLSFQTWEQISEAMNYDVRYLYKLHNRALNVLGKIVDAAQTKGGELA